LPGKQHQIGSPCCTASSRSPLPSAPTVSGWDLDRSARGRPKGCRLIWRGSRTNSVGGSPRMELETQHKWRWTRGFRRVRASGEWNPTSSMRWNYASKGSPLDWSSSLPYTVSGLGFPFEVGGPSSRLVTI
jgi:hypothetical protein